MQLGRKRREGDERHGLGRSCECARMNDASVGANIATTLRAEQWHARHTVFPKQHGTRAGVLSQSHTVTPSCRSGLRERYVQGRHQQRARERRHLPPFQEAFTGAPLQSPTQTHTHPFPLCLCTHRQPANGFAGCAKGNVRLHRYAHCSEPTCRNTPRVKGTGQAKRFANTTVGYSDSQLKGS